MKKSRNSSIELLRILSMCSVIGHHFLKWGGVLDASEFGSIEYMVYWLINGLFFTCVNCFMLITGYFMNGSQMRPSRLLKFWLQVVFYSVVCTVIVSISTQQVPLTDLAKSFVPLTSEQYWFATHYALILCFVPLLNSLIGSLNKEQYKIAVIILFIVFSFMPTFFVWERDLLTSGRDYPWMIILYLSGGYVRKYGINLSQKNSLVGFVICVLITGLVRTPLGMLSNKMIGSDVLAGLFFRYNSVTVYLGAILLFNAMRRIEHVKAEKQVLTLAPLSFAVYLIHDNPNIRTILWEVLPIKIIMDLGIISTIGILVITVVVIYLAGCGVERLRLLLFKYTKIDHLSGYIDSFVAVKYMSVLHDED